MAINSVLNAGVQGLQQSQTKINRAANEIAQAPVNREPVQQTPLQTTTELTEPLIEMRLEQRIFDASAKVVSTADNMLGTLLDTEA